jgi:hypothetical protein
MCDITGEEIKKAQQGLLLVGVIRCHALGASDSKITSFVQVGDIVITVI